MNLEPRQQASNREKRAFYESAAKRFKAECRLTGATAAIHIENKNDEIFWGKVLHEAYPQGKFRFIAASRSFSGNMTAGCTQCLQYREFLDKRFWIAIDSDYRYLTEESGIDANHYVLQTYTYSFENHFCYYKNCQHAIDVAKEEEEEAKEEDAKEEETLVSENPAEIVAEVVSSEESASSETTEKVADKVAESKEATEKAPLPDFSFEKFLKEYSHTVYPLLVWQLYLQEVGEDAFPQKVFHRILALPLGHRSIYNNGDSVLRVLRERCSKLLKHLKKTYPDADTTWYEARCNAQGVHRDNCYLFVRGHQLYDMIVAQGSRFNKHFEKVLTSQLYFGEYDEINKIHEDILKVLR